jgi:hypothetical protein
VGAGLRSTSASYPPDRARLVVPAQSAEQGDISLRLKSGSAQDDAAMRFKLSNYPADFLLDSELGGR